MNQLRAGLSVSGAFLLAALLGAAPPVRAQEDASRATPPPGKALVFVFRSERETVAALVPVFVNLARVGDLANGTFAVATVSPGRTFLRVGDQAVATYTLEVAANQSYFVRVEAVPGVRPVQTEVRIVSASAFLSCLSTYAAPSTRLRNFRPCSNSLSLIEMPPGLLQPLGRARRPR